MDYFHKLINTKIYTRAVQKCRRQSPLSLEPDVSFQ